MLTDIIKAAYLRLGDQPFIAAHFYDVVRAVDAGGDSRSRRRWRTRGEYHGYLVEVSKSAAGAARYCLTPHGIAAAERAA
jgi:hypothetical protein